MDGAKLDSLRSIDMGIVERIRKDPRVHDVWNEGVDGWWVSLNPGYMCLDSDCHAVHEWTLTALRRSFKSVVKCNCKDCVKQP